MASCKDTSGLCEWDEVEWKCRWANNVCRKQYNEQNCKLVTGCVYEDVCSDACELCESCIQSFADLSIDASASVSQIQNVRSLLLRTSQGF